MRPYTGFRPLARATLRSGELNRDGNAQRDAVATRKRFPQPFRARACGVTLSNDITQKEERVPRDTVFQVARRGIRFYATPKQPTSQDCCALAIDIVALQSANVRACMSARAKGWTCICYLAQRTATLLVSNASPKRWVREGEKGKRATAFHADCVRVFGAGKSEAESRFNYESSDRG